MGQIKELKNKIQTIHNNQTVQKVQSIVIATWQHHVLLFARRALTADAHFLDVAIIELVISFNGAMNFRTIIKIVKHHEGDHQVGEVEEGQENHQRAETVAKQV